MPRSHGKRVSITYKAAKSIILEEEKNSYIRTLKILPKK